MKRLTDLSLTVICRIKRILFNFCSWLNKWYLNLTAFCSPEFGCCFCFIFISILLTNCLSMSFCLVRISWHLRKSLFYLSNFQSGYLIFFCLRSWLALFWMFNEKCNRTGNVIMANFNASSITEGSEQKGTEGKREKKSMFMNLDR